MATWSSRGLRGSQFEEMINASNEKYRSLQMALVQKIPTPITPVEMDDERHITLAYFERRSTVDYIGIVQGWAVCFDAKECAADTFALANIHEHQYQFMKDFERQDGISFLLIYFSKKHSFYYMRFSEMDRFYKRAAETGPKHIKYEELSPEYFISPCADVQVHYLEALNKDLAERK